MARKIMIDAAMMPAFAAVLRAALVEPDGEDGARGVCLVGSFVK
jgi:hypothetical protein